MENFTNIFLYCLVLNLVDVIFLFFILHIDYYYNNWKYLLEFVSRLPLILLICLVPPVQKLNKIIPNRSLINTRFFAFVTFALCSMFISLLFGMAILKRTGVYKDSNETFNSINLDVEKHFSFTVSLLVLFYFLFTLTAFSSIFQQRVIKKGWYTHWAVNAYLLFFVSLIFVSVHPELFVSSDWFVAFFVKFARASEFQMFIFVKWLFFVLLVCVCVFFGLTYILDYFHFWSVGRPRGNL